MYNNAGAAGGATGAGAASISQLPDTGGLALIPITGTALDWILLPVAGFALIGGGFALLRLIPQGEE